MCPRPTAELFGIVLRSNRGSFGCQWCILTPCNALQQASRLGTRLHPASAPCHFPRMAFVTDGLPPNLQYRQNNVDKKAGFAKPDQTSQYRLQPAAASATGQHGCRNRMKLEQFRIDDLRRQAVAAGYCVTGLAVRCGVCPRTLERYFSGSYGCTPSAWMQDERMRRASSLLLEGWTVKATALELCYTQANHFSRDYKKHHGFPPSHQPVSPAVAMASATTKNITRIT